MAEHVLVAYYLHSGNTKKLAELIHRRVGGDLHEITPAVPYPRGYCAVVDQAKREIREGHRPELAGGLGSIEQYSAIFIGSPNWWSTIAPPVATFLSSGTEKHTIFTAAPLQDLTDSSWRLPKCRQHRR